MRIMVVGVMMVVVVVGRLVIGVVLRGRRGRRLAEGVVMVVMITVVMVMVVQVGKVGRGRVIDDLRVDGLVDRDRDGVRVRRESRERDWGLGGRRVVVRLWVEGPVGWVLEDWVVSAAGDGVGGACLESVVGWRREDGDGAGVREVVVRRYGEGAQVRWV